MAIPKVEDMMKAGVHFGHQATRWHPKMEQYIFGVKNGIHIIDLEKTTEQLEKIQDFINSVYAQGGQVLFVGTKRQVADVIKAEATRVGAPFLNAGWIGGFITNFNTVIKQTKKYKDLVKQRDSGELNKYTKKEQVQFEKEINKLEEKIGGVTEVTRVPDALFIWDVKTETTAVKEAQAKGIPIIGVCDTNSNPVGIDYVLPVNDDGTKSIQLITKTIADFVEEAKKKIPKEAPKSDKKDAKN